VPPLQHRAQSPGQEHLLGRCPFHRDDTPSFIVTPANNLWYGMGACDEGGNVFNLVMKAEKVTFRKAFHILAELSGAAPPVQTVTTYKGIALPILVAPEDELGDTELLQRVTDVYQRNFSNDTAPAKYLESRCCLHAEAAAHFKIGFADRSGGYLIPPQTSAVGRQLKKRLRGILACTAKTARSI
jgi:DNA primase